MALMRPTIPCSITMPPTVSIIMATYNRSNIISYAIRSVLNGNFQNWELIVVGDACTDDTAEVIAGFDDPRIRYINLEHNFGEQSGPNNIGVKAALGEYIAFLNHDDLWLPNHLSDSIRQLRNTGADLVFGQGLVVSQQGMHSLTGALCCAVQSYEPWMIVPASLWVMKRELACYIGSWRPAREISVVPSQEWLFRAHRAHATLLANPVLSAVLIQSGSRINAYHDRQEAEHRQWAVLLENPLYLINTLAGLLGQAQYEKHFVPGSAFLYAIKAAIRRLFLMCGVWPPSPKFWLHFHRKGSFLQDLRRRRGLQPQLPASD